VQRYLRRTALAIQDQPAIDRARRLHDAGQLEAAAQAAAAVRDSESPLHPTAQRLLGRIQRDRAGAAVAAGRSALDGLRRFWFWMCEDAAGAHRGMGCMIVNSAVEVAPHDPGIRKAVQKIHREIEGIFLNTLKQAQADGELARDKDVQAIARFLTHSTQGIRVMAKVNPTKAYMRDVAEQTLKVLN